MTEEMLINRKRSIMMKISDSLKAKASQIASSELNEKNVSKLTNAVSSKISDGISAMTQRKAESYTDKQDAENEKDTDQDELQKKPSVISTMGTNAGAFIEKYKPDLSPDNMYDHTLYIINKAAAAPFVRVDRDEFLKAQFSKSPYLDNILRDGPTSVYELEALHEKANEIIASTTTKTSLASFASGLPSNPAMMIGAGGLDLVQYFGFAINMSQKIAYLFGEDSLFDGHTEEYSERAKIRIIGYLGAMYGVSGAAVLVNKTSVMAGKTIGTKVASQALTKTAWYPLVKKVGSMIGYKITKQTVAKTINKAVPVIGGVISGGLTYVTFKPLGLRLTDTLIRNINGEFDSKFDFNEGLNQAFIDSLNQQDPMEDAEFIDLEESVDSVDLDDFAED